MDSTPHLFRLVVGFLLGAGACACACAWQALSQGVAGHCLVGHGARISGSVWPQLPPLPAWAGVLWGSICGARRDAKSGLPPLYESDIMWLRLRRGSRFQTMPGSRHAPPFGEDRASCGEAWRVARVSPFFRAFSGPHFDAAFERAAIFRICQVFDANQGMMARAGASGSGLEQEEKLYVALSDATLCARRDVRRGGVCRHLAAVLGDGCNA